MSLNHTNVAVNDIYLVPIDSGRGQIIVIPTRVSRVDANGFYFFSQAIGLEGKYSFSSADQSEGVIVSTSGRGGKGLEQANCLRGEAYFEHILHATREEIADDQRRTPDGKKVPGLSPEERNDYAPK